MDKASPAFDAELSRLVDTALALAEGEERPSEQRAMAMAWLSALAKLVPTKEEDDAS